MAQRHDKESGEYLDHRLVSPREEAVVNGEAVTFAWEPIQEAVSYQLQVAADVSFEEVLFEKQLDEQTTSLTVADVFPTDDRTLYWRVMATDARGQEHGGELIESFISGTAEDEAQHLAQPDQKEEYGPLAELAKGVSAEAAAEITQREEYFEKEKELGVEHEGIAVGQILALMLAITVALVLIVVALIQYANLTAQEVRYGVVGLSGYPELRQSQERAREQLNSYEVLDEEQGIYRIPIDRAIEMMVEENSQQGGSQSPELQAPAEE